MVPRTTLRVALSTVLVLTVSCALSGYGNAQAGRPAEANPATGSTYRFNVAVDEVALLFHASDANGQPINDLNLDELQLLDNGKPPRRIVQFQALQNVPIRGGLLIDTSDSMAQHLAGNRKIASEYAQQFLRTQTDQAFVMEFGYSSRMQQPWTSQPIALTSAIRSISAGRQNSLGGPALFDTIYKACFFEFGSVLF
jgi:Ca-activated chloride channel family protein